MQLALFWRCSQSSSARRQPIGWARAAQTGWALRQLRLLRQFLTVARLAGQNAKQAVFADSTGLWVTFWVLIRGNSMRRPIRPGHVGHFLPPCPRAYGPRSGSEHIASKTNSDSKLLLIVGQLAQAPADIIQEFAHRDQAVLVGIDVGSRERVKQGPGKGPVLPLLILDRNLIAY